MRPILVRNKLDISRLWPPYCSAGGQLMLELWTPATDGHPPVLFGGSAHYYKASKSSLSAYSKVNYI